jgi:FkbM family methyltransferase
MRSLALLARAPIAAGALRGSWWLPTGGGKVWRVLGGSYERGQTELFRRHVNPGSTVLDLGAHIGYYTLLASRLAGPGGRVFAFEPHPRNAWYLRQHARLNGCRNVEVLECAAYDTSGHVPFRFGRGSGTGRVSHGGAVEVRAVRIDEFVAERGITPAVLKVDVEGGERPVLDGARETLLRDRPIVFLSTHGEEQEAACGALLAELDYRVGPVAGARGDLLCVPAERSTPAMDAAIPAAAP